MSSIYEQARAVISELNEIAKLKEGSIVVVGCSKRNDTYTFKVIRYEEV